MADLATIVSGIGSAVSTIGGVQRASATASSADYEAKQIQQQTNIAVANERQKNKEILSKQQAIAAASGVETTSGSPLEIALDSAYQGEMNALRIGYTGESQRQAAKYKARLARSQIPGIIGGNLISFGGKSLLARAALDNRDYGYGLGGNYDTSV